MTRTLEIKNKSESSDKETSELEEIEIQEVEDQDENGSPKLKKSKPDQDAAAKAIIQTLRKHDVQQAQLKVAEAHENLSTVKKQNEELKRIIDELKRQKRDDPPGGLNSVQDTILRAINMPKASSSNNIDVDHEDN